MLSFLCYVLFFRFSAYTRVGGNKKGIFTRTREPKMVAHHVRKRYHALGVELDNVEAPDDIESYVTSYRPSHDEL